MYMDIFQYMFDHLRNLFFPGLKQQKYVNCISFRCPFIYKKYNQKLVL